MESTSRTGGEAYVLHFQRSLLQWLTMVSDYPLWWLSGCGVFLLSTESLVPFWTDSQDGVQERFCTL